MSEPSGQPALCQCGCGEPAPLAKRTWPAKGWVRGEPLRYINGHNRRTSPHDYVEEDRGHETPCWVWQRAVNNKGYALTRRASADKRQTVAHRWYYEQAYGAIPEGLELDHLCRNPICVRPSHMEAVTRAVNIQRGKNAKLTPAMLQVIRTSPLSARQLAPQLGVSYRTVSDVRSGKRWKNV